MFYPPGWADDGVGLELVVEPWLEGLWPVLRSLLGRDTPPPVMSPPDPPSRLPVLPSPPPLEPAVGGSSSLRYSPQLAGQTLDLPARPLDFISVTWLGRDGATTVPTVHQNGAKLPLTDGPLVTATVAANRTLSRPGAVKTYKEMTLSLSSNDETYWVSGRPGDTIGIVCANPASEVDEMARLLGLTERLDEGLAVAVLADTKKARAKVPEFVPRESARLRDLLAECLDLRAVVKKLLLRALVEHTADTKERRRLEEFCSKQVHTII